MTKPYSANVDPNAKSVKLPPPPKHPQRPELNPEAKANAAGTMLLIIAGMCALPNVLGFLLSPSLIAGFWALIGCFFAWMLLQGNNTARFLLLILGAFKALFGLIGVVALMGLGLPAILVVLTLALTISPLAAAIMLFVPPISTHFER